MAELGQAQVEDEVVVKVVDEVWVQLLFREGVGEWVVGLNESNTILNSV